jgi:sensor histidine kinase regulating citrate/malate metabolism
LVYIAVQLALLAFCIMFSTSSIFFKAKQHVEQIPFRWKALLLFSVWGSFLFAFVLSEYTKAAPYTFWLVLTMFIAVANIIILGILWPIILVGQSLNANYKKALHQLDEQVQAQVRHYEQFLQSITEIRKFKHDIGNIHHGVIGHLRNGDTQGALQLLEECSQSIQDGYTAIKTGNIAADALFAHKQSAAKICGTGIVFKGVIPAEYVASLDLLLIFGNALDNAIEACVGLPDEKAISVTSDMRNGFVFINFSNPVAENVRICGNMVATTKIDKESHGIGLASIRNAVEKYDGKMELACENKLFTLAIVLDLNPLL